MLAYLLKVVFQTSDHTHSEFVVEQLKDVCNFMDLNNPKRTADEWINREIIPTDFEQLEEDAHELFQALLPKRR